MKTVSCNKCGAKMKALNRQEYKVYFGLERNADEELDKILEADYDVYICPKGHTQDIGAH